MSYGTAEQLFGLSSAFRRSLLVVLQFPQLGRRKLLECGVHHAEEKAVFSIEKTKTDEV